MDRLEQMTDLARLRRIAQGETIGLDTTRLEQDFLTFSRYAQRSALTVCLPQLYTLQGSQRRMVSDALAALGRPSSSTPTALDISGAVENALSEVVYSQALSPQAPSSGAQSAEEFIFVSLQQLTADHISTSRSYLNPLLECVYSQGAQLLRDFSIHEAVIGKVACMRGDLDLREAHLFPKQFTPGPFSLRVTLETPKDTISRFVLLHKTLEDILKNPKSSMLDDKAMQQINVRALELRSLLGSLSRYAVPDNTSFQVATNTCVIRTPDYTLFYLYLPHEKCNVAVAFGKSPFTEGKTPRDLLVLRGEEHEHTLHKLIECGLYDPSPAVLEARIASLTALYNGMVRGTKRELGEEYPDVEYLIEELRKAENHFRQVVNKEIRTRYVLQLLPALLEFMVCPSTDDPTVHELLPRVSWNRVVRTYHNAERFIERFRQTDETGRKDLLSQITSHTILSNQQNNDVNVWLYKNYRQFCTGAGVQFDVFQSGKQPQEIDGRK